MQTAQKKKKKKKNKANVGKKAPKGSFNQTEKRSLRFQTDQELCILLQISPGYVHLEMPQGWKN